MKYKYLFISMHLFESKALENYFQEMAEKGWQVDRLRNLYIRFHKSEPQKLFYHIGYNESLGIFDLPYLEGKNTNYTAFMESFGYTYISSVGMAQVFVNEQDNPLFSEPKIDEKAFRKATFKDELSKSITAFIMSCFLLLIQLLNFSADKLTDNLNLAFYVFLIVLIIYSFMLMLPYLRYCRHRTVDKAHVNFQLRIYQFFIPILLVIAFIALAVPGYLTGFIVSITFLMLMTRLVLHVVINRVVRKRLWTGVVIVLFVLTYSFVMSGYVNQVVGNQETVEVLEKPFMSAKDLQKQVIDPYLDVSHSILMSGQYYFDSEIYYEYYQIHDTPLQSFCLSQILRDHDFASNDFIKKGGIKIYQGSQTTSDISMQSTILVKGNQVLVVPQYDTSYFIYFENHV